MVWIPTPLCTDGCTHPSPHAPVVDMDVSSSRVPNSRRCCMGASLRFTVWCVSYLMHHTWGCVPCVYCGWRGCKTLSQIVVRSLRHVVVPRMARDVWYSHHSRVPNASFFSVVRPSLVHAVHSGGGVDVRDVVFHRVSRSSCLVDSEQPMTVHLVMSKTPSQIGQTSPFRPVHVGAVPPPLHG